MGLVVVGIAQNAQTVQALEMQLQAAGLPLDAIDVVAPDDVGEGSVRIAADDELLLGDGATHVPGISTAPPVETSAEHSLTERLGDLDIPDVEIPAYAAALHKGCTVVAYFAEPETLNKAQEIFNSAQLTQVHVY